MGPPYKGPWAYFVRCTSCDVGFPQPDNKVLCPLCGATNNHFKRCVGRLTRTKTGVDVWEWREPD